jgi:integrase
MYFGRATKLLMLTGCRREEIGGLLWAEINWEKRQIELPGERTKNGLPHIVPLSEPALAILRDSQHEAHEGRRMCSAVPVS